MVSCCSSTSIDSITLLTPLRFQENVHKPRHKARDTSNIIVPGGRAAAPKPIKADYDEDDACIVKYKQQGYTDEWVAKKLAEEGRVRYVARTVGSRWQRLKKAFVEKEEELLDDDLSDWHVGEVSRIIYQPPFSDPTDLLAG